MSESLSLSAVYARALDKAARASSLPTINDETQACELIQDTLSDLIQLTSRVVSLSLFSSNEILDDVSTPDLAYLSLPFIRAEVQNRVRTTDRDDRTSNLTQVQRHLNMYVSSLETYDIVPETERVLYGQQSSSIRDARKRREVKIKQYKTEKDLRTRMEVIRRRRRQLVTENRSSSDFDLIASLLLPSEDDTEDLETENILREATLLLLRLFYAQACAQLESVNQEFQLLCSAPPSPPLPQPSADERRNKTKDQEDMWKIDATPELPNRKPLLDPHGKSDSAGVSFPPGGKLHSDNTGAWLIYLRRPRTEAEPTSSQQFTTDSEMDGTALGELKAEEQRHKDEQWAQYKDAHPRGAGNTMNCG
ncbi:TAP42-like family-domain-containing protein [Lanmaoa asiatica]|nr:TAP42-like family-domain-containing protein [Lanmaoa asiatica]